MNADTVAILEGNTFVVSDRGGDIDASPAMPHGLFVTTPASSPAGY